MISFVLLMAFCVSALAASHTAGQPAAVLQSAPDYEANRIRNRLLLAEMSTLDGIAIDQEPHPEGLTKFTFVKPNEYLGSVLEPCLPEEKGVYISVGTFRSLNAAASGRASHLILFDYDRGVKIFNDLLLESIALSKDRYDFLCLFFEGRKDGDLELLIEEGREKKMGPFEFVQWLRRRHPLAPGDLVKNRRARGFLLPTEDDWKALTDEGEDVVLNLLPNTLADYERKNLLSKTFFGDDQRFQTLRDLIDGGKVSVVTGDLGGNTALPSVAGALKKLRLNVSALDISNSYDYISNPKQFRKNLEQLPFGEHGRLLMTSNKDYETRNDVDRIRWTYIAATFDKFKRLAPPAGGNSEAVMSMLDWVALGRLKRFRPGVLFSTRQGYRGVLRTLADDQCAQP